MHPYAQNCARTQAGQETGFLKQPRGVLAPKARSADPRARKHTQTIVERVLGVTPAQPHKEKPQKKTQGETTIRAGKEAPGNDKRTPVVRRNQQAYVRLTEANPELGLGFRVRV